MTDIDSDLIEHATPHYTPQRPILRGFFSISRAKIPYFQTNIALEDAAQELKLVESLPSDLRSKWRLEELFQREIDWRRVDHEIVEGYLKRPEKLQFFNAITVALLPIGGNRMLAGDYGDTPTPPNLPTKYSAPPWTAINIGGVELVCANSSPHGYLRWDPKSVFPATIDGQHRLAALKKLHSGGNLTQANLDTSIPVIFLVLDERAGLNIDSFSYGDDQNHLLTIVREVFIDLNKSAQRVSRTRQILLDDQEIESRCVRELLAPRIGDRTQERLPLGLVHWQHKVTAKFNAGDQTGPFITTVELLHAVVRDILDIKKPKDPNEESQIRTFIRSVENSLDVSQVIARNPGRYHGMAPLDSYVERYYLRDGFEQPLANLPAPYLRACNDGFCEHWRRPLVEVLTKFEPYRAFINEVDKRGGIDGDLAFYLCLPHKAQQQQVKDWGEDRYKKLDMPLKQLASMKQDDWPFFAVFQKGLLSATATAWQHFDLVPGVSERNLDEFLNRWIDFLNDHWRRGIFTVRRPLRENGPALFWSGVSLNPSSRTIKWNNVTVTRISGLLLLWWYIRTSGKSRIPTFIKKVETRESDSSYPKARKAIEALRKGLEGAVVGPDEELEEQEITKRVDERLRDILSVALPPAHSEQVVDDPGAASDSLGD
jgi:hypothetical protein